MMTLIAPRNTQLNEGWGLSHGLGGFGVTCSIQDPGFAGSNTA